MADISLQSATEIAITDTTLIPAQPTGGVWSKITGLGIKTYLQSLFDAKVSTTGNETIAGIKTFSSSPIVPTPTTGTQASNKDYSDALNPDFYQYSIVRSVGNLIANNSFETDLSGWSTYGGASNTRVTSQFHHGTASMQVVTTGGGQGTVIMQSGLIVGERYVVSCYAKGNTGGENLNIYVSNATHDQVNNTLTNSWVRYSLSFIASWNEHSIFIRNMSGSATTYYIDAVQLEGGTTTAGPFTTTQGNLTVALKNYEGNDPTPTKPVKIMIGGVVRTITSALSDTFPAGTNWRNAGSPELATKEIDYFCYVGIDNLNNIRFGCSRIPNGTNQNDFSVSGSYTNERYLMDYGISFNVQNIGRFNATLSAGPGYTWSIPATSVIVNSPIRESDWKDISPVITWTGTAPTGTPITTYKYKIVGDMCIVDYSAYSYTPGVSITRVTASLPFYLSGVYSCAGFISTDSSLNLSGGYFIASTAEINCSSVSAERFIIGGTYKI